MSNQNYQIAIIDPDGQVVKVYPQEQYNQHIIEQYRKGLGHSPRIESDTAVYHEPSSTSHLSNQHKTTTEQPSSLNEALEANMVKPFQKFGLAIALVFIAMSFALIFIKLKVGKQNQKTAFAITHLFGAIAIVLVFLFFLQSVK